jgi:hypothetical protein
MKKWFLGSLLFSWIGIAMLFLVSEEAVQKVAVGMVALGYIGALCFYRKNMI